MLETDIDKWETVFNVFMDHAYMDSPCNQCPYFISRYYSDTGQEYGCKLLDMDKGDPELCAGYEEQLLLEETCDD